MKNAKVKFLLVVLRLFLGWIMLWAFIDKMFGLGFASCTDSKTGKFIGVMCEKGAWLAGASPTMGFLKFGTKGPLADFFQSLAGNPLVDWLFMLGLLLIGAALILGIGMRIAGYSGALMLLLMYLAAMPPENNPFIDDHLVYVALFLLLPEFKASEYWGLGKWWAKTKWVKKFPILE